MHRVAEEGDAAIAPWLEHRRRAVVQVPLLNLVLLRRLQDVVDLRAPVGEKPLQVRRRPLWLRDRLRGAGRPREERIPLVAAAADVGDHKVLVGPDVHLVAALRVAVAIVELAGKHRVARVGDATALAARGLVAQLCAHAAPDAVGAHEDVRLERLAALEVHLDARVALLVPLERRRVAHLHAGVLGPGNAAVAPLEQDGLQVGPLDDAGVRHVAHLRWRHQVELGVPLVAHAVLDAVGAVARPRREALNLVVHRAVHVAQVLHRVGRQLDRAAKPLELGRPLDHSHVDWRPRAPQRICRREAADARTRDDHTQRPLAGDGVAGPRGSRRRRRLDHHRRSAPAHPLRRHRTHPQCGAAGDSTQQQRCAQHQSLEGRGGGRP
mmetsp:Transcript_33974/g.85113  ORF Transcript_33974/g.85113 Transcript_33974/m.85113 type:complete len:381 (-) Transcript_33974:11-1153(-)